MDDSTERGRAARRATPRSGHADWAPRKKRRDPVDLIVEQNATRLEWLVPIRHHRMAVSPFTFYRGTARVMAADLASTPTSGLDVQLGGDAHLSNFGSYASPERQLVFDANDFDETLRGPWEWDLKRLATSFTIAGQDRGFSPSATRKITTTVVEAYRTSMAEFASLGWLDTWYEHVRIEDIGAFIGDDASSIATRLADFERRARSRTSATALRKLTVEVDGRRLIKSEPPVLFSLRDLPDEYDPGILEEATIAALDKYKESLPDDRRWLADRYRPVDFGVKVVGVGSVGTRCLIALLEGKGDDDPLFLQAKEAGPSVLEEHLAPSPYDNHGRRVVEGQRLIQAESDIFLGWTQGGAGRDFYVRQLRDWKGSFEVEKATAKLLRYYAALCGHTLARGHARSGDAAAIAAYAGTGDALDRAITAFAEAYAKQNEADYEAFTTAIADGRIDATPG